jgi:hypothetical protein
MIMSMIALICPACSAPLRVDERCLGRKGRCPSCGGVFTLSATMTRPEGSATDDDVLSWLGGSKRGRNAHREAPAPGASPAKTPVRAEAEAPAPAPKPEAQEATAEQGEYRGRDDQDSASREKGRFNIRLDHVDSMGAFFLFDSRLLHDEKFRQSFPRSCILCGSDQDLSVYPVLWSCKLRGKTSKNDLLRQGPYVRRLKDLQARKGPELLAELKEVENVPSPYSLPFPYFVCSSCSPVGALMTHVRTDESKNEEGIVKETCELGICSLSQAEKFAQVVCGKETEAVGQIRQARKACVSDAWRALPLAVRNRIKQWFKQAEEENFIAYISDADFAKAEAGSAGLVVTNRRLVYRKSLSVVEFSRDEQIDVQEQSKNDKLLLVLSGPEGRSAKLAADPGCVDRIKELILRPAEQLVR